LPLYPLAERPLRRWNAIAKRAEDIVISSVALIFLGPLMLIVALAVKLDSPGPALFRQRRHGFNNREIEVYKFRSMRTDMADPTGGAQTRRGDQRITRIGGFLRRSSIDELPQILNVLRGEMSLVGPRPHPVGMRTKDMLCHEIVETYAHRHRVKPGITGWAQINGSRGATSEPEQLRRRVDLDLYYIEHWSILLDLKIMFQTAHSLIATKNAF
jgi:exopolysaccharide biosynthesis polyprenyl glycosylphosphotransferase